MEFGVRALLYHTSFIHTRGECCLLISTSSIKRVNRECIQASTDQNIAWPDSTYLASSECMV